jgi:phosphatidylglycerol:prolipoprotein diacylglycerol transferase
LPWGLSFARSGDTLPRHPTQLYEAAFHLTMAGLLLALAQRGLFRGQLIKLYILSYLGYRFLTEFIRPEPRLLLGLTAYQWAALGLAPVFAWLWWRDARLLRQAQAQGEENKSFTTSDKSGKASGITLSSNP